MSLSECSSAKDIEFAYHTRVIVYKFIGLLPTQGLNQNESFVTKDDNNEKTSGNVPWELSSLPQVSLIDKLKDSEEHFAKNRSVCDELKRKVKRISSESPKSESQKSCRVINNLNSKLYQEGLPQNLLHEIKLWGKLRDDFPEENLKPLTVIQKQARVKVFIDPARQRGTFESSPNQNRFSVHGSQRGSMDLLDISDSETDDAPGSNISWTQKSFARQMSSVSSRNRRFNTYVDVGDIDDETLRSFKTLPSSVIPLKREISLALSQLESDYNSQIQSFRDQTNAAIDSPTGNSPSTSSNDFVLSEDAVSQVADQLRALGDRLQGEYVQQNIDCTVDELVQQFYAQEELLQQRFRETVQLLMEGVVSGWTRVALLLSVGQRLVLRLFESGSTEVANIGEMVANLVHELMGDFILSNGGWLGLDELTPFESLDVSSTDIPNWNDTGDNGILEVSGNLDVVSETTGSNLKTRLTCENDSPEPETCRSHGLSSTPTKECVSKERSRESTNDELPGVGVDKGSACNEGLKHHSRSKTSLNAQSSSIYDDVREGDFPSENVSCNSDRSAFDFLTECCSNPRSALKLSVLVCCSVLFWEFVVMRRGG